MTILIMIAMIIITVTITNIILQATEEAGGNVLLLGHAATLDTCSRQLVGIVRSILDDQYRQHHGNSGNHPPQVGKEPRPVGELMSIVRKVEWWSPRLATSLVLIIVINGH